MIDRVPDEHREDIAAFTLMTVVGAPQVLRYGCSSERPFHAFTSVGEPRSGTKSASDPLPPLHRTATAAALSLYVSGGQTCVTSCRGAGCR